MEQSLKEIRKSMGLTQAEASALVGMPLRTYVDYEN
ncbi:MAG: helix-turn-helix domain-containing protein, partial [Clostridia bacterium]|nr:helix-turn-helix domain-containing protein [Clostridia bacterium]